MPDTDTARRRFLQTLGMVGAASLAGCLGDDADDEDDSVADDDDTDDMADDGDDEPVGEPEFLVERIDPTEIEVEVGQPFDVSATIINIGDVEGEQEIELLVDDDGMATTTLALEVFGQDTVNFESTDVGDIDPGEYTVTIASEDDSASGTLTIESLPDLDDPLLSVDPSPLFFGPNTISGELSSSYNFDIQDGEVELEVPAGWEIVDSSGTSFDELGSFGSQEISWDIEVPEETLGQHDLAATITYTEREREATFEETITVSVREFLDLPWGINNGSEETEYDPVEIDGLVFIEEVPEEVTVLGNLDSYDAGPVEIEDTEHDELYFTEHWGENLGFEIPIQNGTYDVRLHFAEVWEGTIGEDPTIREFDVWVQDELVAENLNLVEEYGFATAVTFIVEDAEVTDNILRIESETHSNNTKFSGFEIRDEI